MINDINSVLQSDNFAATVASNASDEQAKQVLAQLNDLDTSTLNTQGFLTLVQQMNMTPGSSGQVQNQSQRTFNKHLFRLADKKLVEFSKTHQAWQVVFEVLQNASQLDDQSVFQAASILKNKTMYDFVAFRMHLDASQSQSAQLQMCRDLVQLVTLYSSNQFRDGKPAPRFILNTLCTALAYLTIHTHLIWPQLISDITLAFSSDVEQAFCLLRILKYMAEDCDNEQIVVEESLKESYYNYLDSHAREHIFKNIFTQWAQNIPSLNVDKTKVTFLQNRLMDTFLAWIRLALPTEVFENLLTENGPMIDLVFQQLGSEDDENLQVAVNCIVELMTISKVAKNNFQPFIALVGSKQHALMEHVQKVIASGDTERAEQFTSIFVEIAFCQIDTIIEQGSQIIDVLLAILEMEDSNCFQQLAFWRDLFRRISKIEDDSQRMAKFQQFEQVVVKLINVVLKRAKMDDSIFVDFNREPSLSSEFEDIFAQRRDLAILLKGICKSCGSLTVYQILSQFLSQNLAKQQNMAQLDQDQMLDVYIELEVLLFCTTQVARCIESSELSRMKDVIQLVQNLIKSDDGNQQPICQKYIALRHQCTNFIQAIAYPLGKFGNEASAEVKEFVQFALLGFKDARLTLEPSVLCFVKLCCDCSEVLSPFTEEFINQILVPEFIATWTYTDVYRDIIQGFAYLVDKVCQQDMQRCTLLVPQVAKPLLVPLNEAIMEVQDKTCKENLEEGQMPTVNRKLIETIQDLLDLLADLFQGFSEFPSRVTTEVNPLANLFVELWPFVDRLMTEFVNEDGVVEAICRLMKHGMRSMSDQFAPYLQPLIRKALTGYQQNSIGSFIYTVEFSLTQFGKKQEHQALFQEALDFIVSHTIQVLASRENCQRSKDLVNDFFGLNMRYLRYNKTAFFSCSQLQSFVQILLNTVGLEHYEAATVHSRFIKELLQILQNELFHSEHPLDLNNPITKNQTHMWEFFKQQGGALIQEYFTALLKVPSKEVAEIFTDAVGVLCVAFMEEGTLVRDWITKAVQIVPINVLTVENREQMVKTVSDSTQFRLSSLAYQLNLLGKRARSSAIRH